MTADLIPAPQRDLPRASLADLPAVIANAGKKPSRRFLQFFIAEIENDNTRANYANAVGQFLDWCHGHKLKLETIDSFAIATYMKYLQKSQGRSKVTAKNHLAAIRRLFDYLVTGQIMEHNPALSVRGPKHKVSKNKTPILTAQESRQLLDSIDTSHVVGLRDRALIATMLYTFGRVSAVLHMTVDDYYFIGQRGLIRLHEKGGKDHEIPAHHKLQEYLDAYIAAAAIGEEKKRPLFRSTRGRSRLLTDRPLLRRDALAMVKRRAKDAGLTDKICNHSWRGTGLTIYMKHGGKLEVAQQMAAHADSRTTRGYIRLDDEIERSEIERVQI